MAQNKFGCWRAMLSFQRQPFPGTSHVDQDVAHSQAWRALGHLTTFDRVLSALHPKSFARTPDLCTQPILPRATNRGQHRFAPGVHFGANSDLCATAYLRALRVSALRVAAIAGWIRVISKHDRRCWPVKRPRHRLQTNPTPRQAMLADGRTVIGNENWRAHQACATLE